MRGRCCSRCRSHASTAAASRSTQHHRSRTDGDGLPNQCEKEVFGTDPSELDSDGDGTADGDEDADGDGATNQEEQDAVGDYGCPPKS